MLKTLNLFLLILCLQCHHPFQPSCYAVEKKVEHLLAKELDPSSIFVTEQLSPSPLLIELLIADGLYDPNDSFREIVQKTQRKWIAVRQGENHKERSDLVDSPERQAIFGKVIDIAFKMGLFSEHPPVLQEYKYGVCLGAFLNGVRGRLARLIDAWEKGIRFESLVFLTGERYLRSGKGEQDDFALLCDPTQSVLPFKPDWQPPDRNQINYATEYDMVKLIWEQTAIPESMERVLKDKVFFVNASKGNASRASTKDTYITWLEEFKPVPGTILAASDPLLSVYQQLTGMAIMGQKYPLNTFAPGASSALMKKYERGLVSLVLDTVAKCLYEIDLLHTR